jgi:glycerate kinase
MPYVRPILVAPDSFKGTFTAQAVAAALGRGLESAGLPPPDLCPLADGGEGTLAVLLTALGGETAGAEATDPLGRTVAAGFGLVEDGGTAIVEVAEASGLHRVGPGERDAEASSSRGTGELIAAAVDRGAQVVLVAAGGSATTDGGAGAIAAIEEAGGLRGARLVVLCDVRTPFEHAARVFAPQKGADAAAVGRLSKRLAKLAQGWPRDPRGIAMSGAAGIIVGEGRLDETSLEGKALGEAATRARQAGVPCFAVVGTDALDRFGARILDLQRVLEAPTLDAVEHAAADLASLLPTR